jgi:sugar lactone lactonase YvrE
MSARHHKGSVRAGVVVVVAVCVLLLVCSSAFAAVAHRFEGSFDGAGTPEGSFPTLIADATDDSSGPSAGDVYVAGFGVIDKLKPDGSYAEVQITGEKTPQGSFFLFSGSLVAGALAVDGSSGPNAGDLYVSDMEHGVVDRFKENGEFDCQITGKTPGSPTEVEHECAGAVGSATPDGSIEPAGITVDKATGDVWVADRAHAAIDEYDPAGEYVGQITDPHIVTPGPIALDSAGNLYVTNGGTLIENEPPANNVVVFNEGKFVRVLDEHRPLSVAVDPSNNHVYVFESEGRTLAEYDPAGNLIDSFVEQIEGQGRPVMKSVAVSSDGHIYGAETYPNPGSVMKYSPDLIVPTVTTEAATAVSETSATLHGNVDPDAARGGGTVTECNFEYVTQQAFENEGFKGAAKASCSPAAPITTPQAVSATPTLAPSTTYKYRLSASNANEVLSDGQVMQLSTVGPPLISAEKAETLTASGVVLHAKIAASGFEADCHVEYVNEGEFQESGFSDAAVRSCAPSVIPAGSIGEAVSATVQGLFLSTTYHYRFASVNSAGETQGADETFATFGIKTFSFGVLNSEGQPYTHTQAGGHPYEWVTSFTLNTTETKIKAIPLQAADANIREVETDLPPGLTANATATPRCPRYLVAVEQCSPATQVGEFEVQDALGDVFVDPLYNVTPPPGVPVELGAVAANLVRVYIDGNVRTGGDYGATAKVVSASEEDNIVRSRVAIWGVPADSRHDKRRVCPVAGKQVPVGETPCSTSAPHTPLLTNPSSCPGTPLVAHLHSDSWQAPGEFVSASSEIPATTGCESLDFTPSVSIAPDTTVADAPSGLTANIEVPQNETAEGLATSSLENTTVELPAGVSVSPSAANGLEACSEAQIGLHSEAAPQCPNGSKIGTVEITSPLIADHLTGGVYVARQGENPFGSLLAMYIAAEADGARVKLAGHIVADPVSGQLTTTFTETPQIPFNDFKLNLFGGRRGALATPNACGAPNTNVSLAPWDGLAPTKFELPFTTSTGCVSGFAPAFEAGTVSAQAGAYAPFTLSFSRSDSEENLAGATVTLPPGLIGKIAGVAQCSDAQLAAAAGKSGVAELASPSCPAGSLIGTVQTTAGPGPSPVSVSGKAYLTGPYKGGPYGIAVVVPAVAGPYDLGTVVIRQSLRIDRSDAHVTDTSDPFPTILQGVPLRIKSVNVTLDRPGFTFNPTSCEPKTINATLESTGGAKAGVSSRFQAVNCASLKFAPKFSASTAGKASKANGASLDVKVGYPTGPEGTYANIKAVKVDLPKQLPSRLTTLQKACLAATFEANPASCPKASNVGTATATTPVLNVPLTGPAYIVSHGGEAFPDLEIVLQGENVTLILVGNTQIKNGITSSTFKTIPDAPVSSFELKLPTGQFSILGANVPQSKKYNLCGQSLPMPTQITAQNGAVIKQTTKIAVTGCPKAKKTTAKRQAKDKKKAAAKGKGRK